MYRNFIKPSIDIILSLIGFLLTFPVFLIVTILLTFANRGNPFFIQTRPGKNGKSFKVIKHKTMNDKKDKHGNLLPDSQRLTPIGNFVRKSSLDELPQLINVLKGDMSLVGPRPLLVEYLNLYSNEQVRRHEVSPGITGWAQVNGRNTLSWRQKFEYDVWYVDHLSLKLDIKILFITVKKVLKREGISGMESVSMEKFVGQE